MSQLRRTKSCIIPKPVTETKEKILFLKANISSGPTALVFSVCRIKMMALTAYSFILAFVCLFVFQCI